MKDNEGTLTQLTPKSLSKGSAYKQRGNRMIHPWDHSWICLSVEICLVWGKKHNLWMCNFPQWKEMCFLGGGQGEWEGRKGRMGWEPGRQHFGLKALSKNRRSCSPVTKWSTQEMDPKGWPHLKCPNARKLRTETPRGNHYFKTCPREIRWAALGSPFLHHTVWYIE